MSRIWRSRIVSWNISDWRITASFTIVISEWMRDWTQISTCNKIDKYLKTNSLDILKRYSMNKNAARNKQREIHVRQSPSRHIKLIKKLYRKKNLIKTLTLDLTSNLTLTLYLTSDLKLTINSTLNLVFKNVCLKIICLRNC